MIQISYLVNLIPRNCAIPEWLTTCKYSDFWRNEHVFSYVTILVTVSKGSSTYVSACIELLSARVLQFETLRGLTIMLEVCVCVCVCVGGAMEEVQSMSSLPNNEFWESTFKKEDLIESL